jgi:hypothetical protein
MTTDPSTPPPAAASGPSRSTLIAFRIVVVLITLVIAQSILMGWMWRRTHADGMRDTLALGVYKHGNQVRKAFPEVDFTRVYPDLEPQDIDELQQMSGSIRYVYAPFVEIAPLPLTSRFVNITSAGYRGGLAWQPWPPRKGDLVVFVFGGSTTFGYQARDQQTVVSYLQVELAGVYADRVVQCYNFGRGYYFSSQERALFESLLLQGVKPDVAVFIEGLNDFNRAIGEPMFTPVFQRLSAPDIAVAPVRQRPSRELAVEIVARMGENIRLTTAACAVHGVQAIFVGQPVPFHEFPANPTTYPFHKTWEGHELCEWEYPRFREAAERGEFGKDFIWCGDAFKDAQSIMYADSIHYSPEGNRRLAHVIVERARAAGLLR